MPYKQHNTNPFSLPILKETTIHRSSKHLVKVLLRLKLRGQLDNIIQTVIANKINRQENPL